MILAPFRVQALFDFHMHLQVYLSVVVVLCVCLQRKKVCVLPRVSPNAP